jgi:hypothetical protein
MKSMEFTADQVWGLAVRADSLNDGYVKEAQWDYEQPTPVLIKEANKKLVKQWLTENLEPTAAEITQGQEYRRYFNSFTLRAIAGKLNDFETQALKIAQMDQFTGRNLLEFAIVSCLPSVARRDQQRTELKREIYASEQLLGAEGQPIQGEVEILGSRFNPNYNKYKITARMGESFIDFWFGREAKAGDRMRIKGKIKAQRGDKTTQLNFVKLVRG